MASAPPLRQPAWGPEPQNSVPWPCHGCMAPCRPRRQQAQRSPHMVRLGCSIAPGSPVQGGLWLKA